VDHDWPPDLPPLASEEPLGGGYICRAARGRLADGRRVVVKRCPYPAEAEADGLAALAAAGAPVPAVLGAAGPVLVLECRHFAGKRPFAHEQRLINLAAVPEAAEEAFFDTAPGPWLIGRVPWSAAEHRIRAVAAEKHIAAALDIATGAPCLVIERRTWSAEHPVTHVRFTYAAENHTLVARFTPSTG